MNIMIVTKLNNHATISDYVCKDLSTNNIILKYL